jgi:hypothetical protein
VECYTEEKIDQTAYFCNYESLPGYAYAATMELTFEVIQQIEGSYVAACYSENIYTEGSSLEELHGNIVSLIDYRFQGRTKPEPSAVKLMLFRE